MYFWNIRQLKNDLSSRSISINHALGYFLLIIVLMGVSNNVSILFPIQHDSHNLVYLSAALHITIPVAGALYLFICNGGKQGKYFFERYFSLLFVVGVRFLIFFVIPMIFLFGGLVLAQDILFGETQLQCTVCNDAPQSQRWYPLVVETLIFALYYWRVSVHLTDVAKENNSP